MYNLPYVDACLKSEALRRAFGTTPFTAAEAREVWGIRNVDSTLNRLKQAGVIERVSRGVYCITDTDAPLVIGRHLEQNQIQALRRKRDVELSDLAGLRWRSWMETGYVEKLGANRYRVNPPKDGGKAHVRLR